MSTLQSAVAAVEQLSLEDQKMLRSLLSEAVYKKQLVHNAKKGEDISGLLLSGFVCRLDDPEGYIIAPEHEKIRRRLCTYLSRRNENDSYFDPETGDFKEIPKGSQFKATVSIGLAASTSLTLSFPDDEITALLDHYGVNRCKWWTA